jgi:hypothetical protein
MASARKPYQPAVGRDIELHEVHLAEEAKYEDNILISAHHGWMSNPLRNTPDVAKILLIVIYTNKIRQY